MPTPEDRAALRRKIESLIGDLDAVHDNPLVAPGRARLAKELVRQLRTKLMEFGTEEMALRPSHAQPQDTTRRPR